MKIYLFILYLCAFANVAYSQGEDYDEIEFEDNELKNREIKLNLVGAPWGYVSVAYEHNFFYRNFSVGAELGTSFKDDVEVNFDFSVVPFIRKYFNAENKGFFAEAIYVFARYEDANIRCFTCRERQVSTVHGPGGSLGAKYFLPNGFYGEFVFGVGLNNNDNRRGAYEDLYTRFGIQVGKRF
jgi:hypothetical protein